MATTKTKNRRVKVEDIEFILEVQERLSYDTFADALHFLLDLSKMSLPNSVTTQPLESPAEVSQGANKKEAQQVSSTVPIPTQDDGYDEYDF